MRLPDNELIWLIWAQVWQVTAVAAVVGILVRIGCRRRPHLAYLLWMLVIVKCLTPPLWSSPTGVFSWALHHPGTAARQSVAGVSEVGVSDVGRLDVEMPRFEVPDRAVPIRSQPDSPQVIEERQASSGTVAPSIEPASWIRQHGFSGTTLLGAIWLMGAVLLGSLAAAKWLGYRRLLKGSSATTDGAQSLAEKLAARLGLRKKVRLMVTSSPIGPAVVGLLRPTVLLPEALLRGKSSEQIEPILAHELIHIRRGDALTSGLQLATQIIWWFHPLVWWANRQACRERERCCDEEVMARLCCKPAAYASCLLEVLELERSLRSVLVSPGVRPVEVTSRRSVISPTVPARASDVSTGRSESGEARLERCAVDSSPRARPRWEASPQRAHLAFVHQERGQDCQHFLFGWGPDFGGHDQRARDRLVRMAPRGIQRRDVVQDPSRRLLLSRARVQQARRQGRANGPTCP